MKTWFPLQLGSFSSKFRYFFSAMRDNSSVLFRLKFYMLLAHIKVQIFRLATDRIKIHQIPHVIFGNKSQFFFKLCITLSCHMRHDFFIWISASFGQAHPIKVPIFRLSSTRIKINQIAYVIFQPTSQFSLKLCNALQCHDT